MTFNIGTQNAAVINNVAGDQRIEGGQQGTVVTTEQARRAVRDLRDGLAATRLDETTARQARTELAAAHAAVHAPEPDRSRVAQALRRFTQLLSAAGSLANAGTTLIGPLRALAGWLGALGAPILHALAMMV
jgi:Spy/CpxP family protein refolding chaperone